MIQSIYNTVETIGFLPCLLSVALWVNKPLLNTRNVEQTKYVLCTLKNIYSSRYLDALLYKMEHCTALYCTRNWTLNEHWKNAGLYTLATKE